MTTETDLIVDCSKELDKVSRIIFFWIDGWIEGLMDGLMDGWMD